MNIPRVTGASTGASPLHSKLTRMGEKRSILSLAAGAFLAIACGTSGSGDLPDAAGSGIDAERGAVDASAPPPDFVAVYAHSPTTLYRLDPDSGQ